MAVKRNHRIIREWRHPQKRTGAAITDRGFVLVKRRAGGTWSRTRPRRGKTLAELAAIYEGAGYERVDHTSALAFPDSHIPNPVAKAEARDRASGKRADKRRKEHAARVASERAIVSENGEILPTRVVPFVVQSLRAGRKPETPELAYVFDMARFHGGATGGYLGTAVGAGMLLERDDPRRYVLDACADACAREVYGSSLEAAKRWGKALGRI